MTLNISCPHCNVTNRIPKSRLTDGPKCGKCKSALFMASPLTLTTANFAKQVQANELPVLVDCWADWCGPCKQFAPIFASAAKEFEPNVRLLKLDTQAEQGIASQWNIRSIPTLILFNKGKEVARTSGVMPVTQLRQWLLDNNVSV